MADKPQVHAVGVIVENGQGKILVLLRHPDVPEGSTWGLSGGKVSEGRTSIQTALVKLSGETGIALRESDLVLTRSYHWNRHDMDLQFDVYRARVGK